MFNIKQKLTDLTTESLKNFETEDLLGTKDRDAFVILLIHFRLEKFNLNPVLNLPI